MYLSWAAGPTIWEEILQPSKTAAVQAFKLQRYIKATMGAQFEIKRMLMQIFGLRRGAIGIPGATFTTFVVRLLKTGPPAIALSTNILVATNIFLEKLMGVTLWR